MENIFIENDRTSRKLRTLLSYQTALYQYKKLHGLARISWGTCLMVSLTIAIWCITAYQVAVLSGAHTLFAILANIMNNAVDIKDNDALSTVLINYGAKDNDLIVQGQYWRFVKPIFLHANLLHVGLNMLNLAVLGVFLERVVGHLRYLFIYFVTGIHLFCYRHPQYHRQLLLYAPGDQCRSFGSYLWAGGRIQYLCTYASSRLPKAWDTGTFMAYNRYRSKSWNRIVRSKC